jgi:TIR domain-containing protein
MAAVFISYRRDDAAGYAVGINKALRDAGFEVFMDVDSIAPGDRFPAAIQQALDSSEALVVLIGKRWLTVADDRGRRRLDDRRDYVRREIVAALDRGIDVIPTLVDGAGVPNQGDLPGRLSKLADFQCLELDNERWDYDLGRLVKRLRRGGRQSSVAGFWHRLRPRARPSRRAAAAGAVLAVIAAAVLVTFLVRGNGGSPPRPPPERFAAAKRIGASTLRSPGLQLISGALVDAGSTLVAVGRDRTGTGPLAAAAWRSTDAGRHWNRAHVASEQAGGDVQMSDVVRLGGGSFAAVGQQSGELTSWVSTNGISWAGPHVLQELGGQTVKAVTATPTAVIAVGGQSVTNGLGRDAAVWRSTDGGATWEAAHGDFGGTDTQVIEGVVARNGLLVAVGYDNAAGAAVWISRNDGRDWQRVRIAAVGAHEQMDAVTADGSVLVAVGSEGSGQGMDGAVWTSVTSGRSWQRVARRELALPAAQKLSAVVASRLGLVAVGSDKSGGAQRAAAWRSTDDGRTWKRVRGLDGSNAFGSMAAVAAAGDAVFGLGQGILGGDADAAAWSIRLKK